MNYKRNSILFVLLNIIKTIPELISSFLFLVVFLKLEINTVMTILSIFLISSIIYISLSWYKSIFYIKDDIFYNDKGIFIRKNINVSLDKIQTVDVKASLLHKLLGLRILNIDIGVIDESSDFTICLKKDDAINFKKLLLKENNQLHSDESTTIHHKEIYKIRKTDLFLYVASKLNIFYVILSLTTIYFFISEYNLTFLIPNDNLLLTLLLIFIGIIGSIIVFAFKNYDKYYNFTLSKANNKLIINHGFTQNNISTLNLDNVYSVKVKQSLLQKFFSKVTISISIFGYGNEESEAVIFPSLHEDHIDEVMDYMFSKFVYKDKFIDIHNKYKLRYGKNKLGYNEELLVIYGGILSKKRNFISMDSIEEIKFTQNYFLRKDNLQKLRISYKSMLFTDLKHIKGISIKDLEHLETYLLNKN